VRLYRLIRAEKAVQALVQRIISRHEGLAEFRRSLLWQGGRIAHDPAHYISRIHQGFL
jgi:hypothetical protein